MAWYYGTYSCGHDGRVNIIGPTKDREWRKERAFEKLCPKCYDKHLIEQRKKANKEAAEKSKEMELPELIGTEKQVAWANSLRMEVVNEYEKLIEEAESVFKKYGVDNIEFHGREAGLKITIDDFSECVNFALTEKIDARFWIDNRNERKQAILVKFYEEYKKLKKKTEIPKDVKDEIAEQEAALTVTNDDVNNKKDGIVKIKIKDNELLTIYVKDDDFIKIVKSLRYKWDCDKSVWKKEINEFTGNLEERIAELGNKLLSSGFTVQFPDEESKTKAIAADFTVENNRWIKYNIKSKKLAICWSDWNNTLYNCAKKLPGAKWNNGSMKVKIEFYKEIEDFAKTMGFSISKKAKEEIEKYKEKESNFSHEKITAFEAENIDYNEKLKKYLKSSGTIISDLIDD